VIEAVIKSDECEDALKAKWSQVDIANLCNGDNFFRSAFR
jgi:hypothetical protein